jgi:hypothetical protein
VYPDDHGHVPPEVIAGYPQLGIGHVWVELANLIQVFFLIFDHAESLPECFHPGKELKISTARSRLGRLSHIFPPIQDFDFCYSTSATVKAAGQAAASAARLTKEQGSSCNLFLRLLFALEQAQHHGQKTLPSSMYVPSRATIITIGSKDPIFVCQNYSRKTNDADG